MSEYAFQVIEGTIVVSQASDLVSKENLQVDIHYRKKLAALDDIKQLVNDVLAFRETQLHNQPFHDSVLDVFDLSSLVITINLLLGLLASFDVVDGLDCDKQVHDGQTAQLDWVNKYHLVFLFHLLKIGTLLFVLNILFLTCL